MKIVAVVPGFSRYADDAAIPALRALLVALAGHGVEVSVLALRHPPGPASYDLAGLPVWTLGGGTRAGPGRLVLLAQAIDAAVKLGQGADVIVGFWADEPGFVAVHAAARLGIRSHVALMGGELADLAAIGYGGAGQAFGPACVDVALRRATRVSVGSRWLRDHGSRPGHGLGAAAAAVVASAAVLPLGLDVAAFAAAAAPWPRSARGSIDLSPLDWSMHDGAIRIGSLGNLLTVKNHASLLRAVARLRHAGANVVLELAGDGPEASSLRALAVVLGVGHALVLCGAIPHALVPSWLATLDLHVLPSHWESQGMASLEAAAVGVAVAGTHVGALADFDAACFRVAAGDDGALLQALAAVVERVRLAPDALAVAGAAARDEVRQRYDLGAVAAGWQRALYESGHHARRQPCRRRRHRARDGGPGS